MAPKKVESADNSAEMAAEAEQLRESFGMSDADAADILAATSLHERAELAKLSAEIKVLPPELRLKFLRRAAQEISRMRQDKGRLQ